MNEHSNIQAAIDAGQAMSKPFEVEGVQAVMIPGGAKLETLEHLQELDRPRHIKNTVEVRSADEFVSYFNRFANEDSSIYINVDKARFEGVIDHHGKQASFANHKVIYCCPETDEWQSWKKYSEVWMDQEQFATFLEDHHLQIFKPTTDQFKPEELDVVHEKLPDAARMLDTAKTLEVTSGSSIKSGQNLHNGTIKIEYVDEVEGRAGVNGEFEIPVYFVIAVDLFKDGKGYLMLCRLKYRKEGPSIRLRYELVRPSKTHEHAVQDVIARIRDGKPDPDPENDGQCLENTRANTPFIYEIV